MAFLWGVGDVIGKKEVSMTPVEYILTLTLILLIKRS
jgi:hypothetical protein